MDGRRELIKLCVSGWVRLGCDFVFFLLKMEIALLRGKFGSALRYY